METISFESLAAFALGMAVVYMMFRGMGVFVLALVISVSSSSAQVAVTNWPDSSNPLPVYIAQQSSPDVWPSALAGMGFGFTVCGFGMVLRMAKKIGNDA